MRGKDLLEKMELIDHNYVKSAESARNPKKPIIIKRIGAIAACIALLLSTGFGTYIYAEEVKEYNEAIEFFDENELSSEGLSRSEIKKVYRDITTGSFTYSKTEYVIISSLAEGLTEGYEISQDEPTPLDIENLWNYILNKKEHPEGDLFYKRDTIQYKYQNNYEKNDSGYLFNKFISGVFGKYDGDTTVWETSFSEFSISGFSVISNGVIVYGENNEYIYGEHHKHRFSKRSHPWIAKIDESGNVLWKKMISDESPKAYVKLVLENKDGSYAIFCQNDNNTSSLRQYTSDGKETHYKELGDLAVINGATFGDGYILHISSSQKRNIAQVIKVDPVGNITEYFSYSDKNVSYSITDMIEYNGKIYLSAYAVSGSGYELRSVLDHIRTNDLREISTVELTPMVRDIYTAMLFVCDPNEGTPQEFYSVNGSLGGELSLSDNGNLLWEAESIETMIYSPTTSSYTFAGICRVFQYAFDKDGTLITQEKTNEITSFRR